MIKKGPDFVIAGAPKCGTTSLYNYLKAHPEICMHEKKEPFFFGSDMPEGLQKYSSQQAYLEGFPEDAEQKPCGEASVLYFSSKDALTQLLDSNPETKIVVALRNPSEIFFSLHAQYLKTLDEDIKDPEKAWHAQERRKSGQDIPRYCRGNVLLNYADICSIGDHLEKLVKLVPTQQRKVIFFDDIKNTTAVVIQDLYSFLDVLQDFEPDWRKFNESAELRSRNLEILRRYGPKALRPFLRFARTLSGYVLPGSPADLNKVPLSSDKFRVSKSFLKELDQFFAPQIQKIEVLTGRDLAHWRLEAKNSQEKQELAKKAPRGQCE